jgi:hypothetical protein
MVTNQKVGSSNLSGRTIKINNLHAIDLKTADPVAHPHRVAWLLKGVYSAVMEDAAIIPTATGRLPGKNANPLGQPLGFDVRGLGRRLPRTEAPEGWLKKIERRREGKVWVGFSHLWTSDANGHRVRTKKEKTLGPASLRKHEAQEKLATYISEYTDRLAKQGDSTATFSDLWKAFCAVKSDDER